MRIATLFELFFIMFFQAYVSPCLAGAIRHDVPDTKYRELANQLQFESVGLILKDGKPNASCVLLTPEWIITAGHEVESIAIERLKFQFGKEQYTAKELIISPNYQSKGLGHGTDLALIRLDRHVKNIKPAKLYTGSNELGLVGTSVGFGRSGAGRSLITNPEPVGTKRAGQNVIDAVGGEIDKRKLPHNLLISDFDHPDDISHNRIGDSKSLDLEYCPLGGDSGGGLFIQQNGDWMLAGVVSAFTPKIHENLDNGIYGSLMYWTRISLYDEWIEEELGKRRQNPFKAYLWKSVYDSRTFE